MCAILSENSTKTAIVVEEKLVNYFYTHCQRKPEFLKENMLTLPVSMVMTANHFMFRVIDDIFGWLVQAGIPQYFHNFYNWYKFIRHQKSKTIEEFKSISLDSLSFGFIIWLAACGVSILVFAFEMGMWHKIKTFWMKKWKADDDNIKQSQIKPNVIQVSAATDKDNFSKIGKTLDFEAKKIEI